MARPPRHPGPPVAGGGYEFEVVRPGPPTYFTPPPPVAARGGLRPAGDGEGLIARPAPGIDRRNGKTRRMKLRLFTARFRDPTAPGAAAVTVQGHELRYTPGGLDRVVRVVLHHPAGTIAVAVFRLDDLLGVFECDPAARPKESHPGPAS